MGYHPQGHSLNESNQADPGTAGQPDPRFRRMYYRFRKRFWAWWGQRVDVFDEHNTPLIHLYQKAFRLREDVRLYGDAQHTEELLAIQARQIIDFAAAYDVYDRLDGTFAGTLRRKGWQSLARDEWELLNSNQQPVARIREDSLGSALLRRFLLGALLPASFHFEDLTGRCLATVRTRFNLFFTDMELGIAGKAAESIVDPRLFIAATALLVLIEGKQESYG